MDHIYSWILLMVFASISLQQCAIEEFEAIVIGEVFNQSIVINRTFYNCLSRTQTSNVYSSMSVSIVYIKSDDPNNTHEVRYNLQCNNNIWKIVGNQSTALKNNSTRFCKDCTNHTVNEFHCTG